MQVGILGPSNFKRDEKFRKIISRIAMILISKKHDIIISPDKDSIAELFALEFKKVGGFIVGIDYKDDADLGYSGLNRQICDKLISCETWENQPKAMVSNADAFIVLGLSVGVTWEICLTKFYWKDKRKIFVIKETCKDKLPSYLLRALPIQYIPIKELEEKL